MKKDLILPSTSIFNTLNHIDFLSSGSKELLKFFAGSLRVRTGGHDLTDTKYFSNSEIAKKILKGVESVRQHKEDLHAHNVILIDGKTWGEYQVKDRNGILRRFKTDQIQSVSLSQNFIDLLVCSNRDKKLGDVSSFIPDSEYVNKVKIRKEKNRASVMKYIFNKANKLLISLGNSCEEVPMKLVAFHREEVPMKCGQLLISENRIPSNKDINSSPASQGLYGFDSSKKLNSVKEILSQSALNRNLVHTATFKNIAGKKEFTGAVKAFCDDLIKGGMAFKDVAFKMVEQRYAATVEEFKMTYYRLSLE